MATLTDVRVGRQATSVPGLYVRDVPLKVVRDMNLLSTAEESTEAQVVLYMFEHLLCGEDGSKFEDVTSEDDVLELGVLTIRKIMEAVREALDVEGKS